MKPRIAKYRNDVYGVVLMVTFGDTLADSCLALPACMRAPIDKDTSAITAFIGKRFSVSFSKDISYSMVGHECFHAADKILERAGLRLVDESDEAYAYLMGWCMKKIMKSLIQWKVKIK